MKLDTDRFGVIEVDESQGVFFEEGLLGFPDSKRFYIVSREPGVPLKWLQDAHDPSLAFVIIDPRNFRLNYAPGLSQDDMDALEIGSLGEAEIYTLVVIPRDPEKMTANLRGPLIVNARTRKARQVILESEEYGIRHNILQEFRQAAEQKLKIRKGAAGRQAG